MIKNIIAGETYAEPSGTITVKSSTGYKAVAEFAKGGMWSGRSEDVVVKAFDGKRVNYHTVLKVNGQNPLN